MKNQKIHSLILVSVPLILAASWGSITGTLSNQTDLQSALNAKAVVNNPVFTGQAGIGQAVNLFDKFYITSNYDAGEAGHPPQFAINYFNDTDALMDGLTLRRYRGSYASPDFPANGDWLGALLFAGYIGGGQVTSARSAAGIRGQATETWTSSVNGAKLIFAATPSGSQNRNDVATLDGDGNLRINGSLGVGNAASASSSVGSLVKKVEIFDSNGSSLGFIPVYSSIN